MAQKRRGLGRGLQALIPETQAETPSARPTDVFFPDSQEEATAKNAEATDDQTSDEASQAEGGQRTSDDIAATLLAPSKRTKKSPSKSSAAKGTSRRSSAAKENSDSSASASKKKASTRSKPSKTARSVSRETSAKNDSEKVEKRREEPAQAAPEPEEVPADIKVKEAETVKDGDTEESSLVPVPGATFADLPVNLIAANPHQPRQVFDEDDITELAASIKEVGLLQPIVVRRREHGDDGEADYELIMGERRLRAAKEAGLETIPAVVRYAADEDLLRDALLENLHRVQLNPLEEAAAYQQLLEDFNCTHAELSQRIARSRSQISNTLRLMKLPPLVQRRLAAGVLSAGHARALLGLPDVAAMERIAQRIVAEGLSVRATEELVALHDEPDTRRAKPLRTRSATLPALSTRLSDAFDTRVKVTRGAKKGRITIEFAGDDDLARIVTALAPGTSLDEE
ncbi:ParB/RepB/Spo0J family partition protein [Actinomyces massiliensis]|uniref:ParB/RepB/Spo0J family partition protein n=1 Tax=Actinomyces massiliensis TaxID=461393 RepID=UPI0002F4C761|nr:ParB/RepB/Spo0J family partition protein [Actinomyces massiliensis]